MKEIILQGGFIKAGERPRMIVDSIDTDLALLELRYHRNKKKAFWRIFALNIGYGCCLILYIFYFRGTFQYLASKMLPTTCTCCVRNRNKKAGIQSTVELSASSARPVTVRPHNVERDKSKTTTGPRLSVNPMHAKMKQFKRSHPPVSRLSTLVWEILWFYVCCVENHKIGLGCGFNV